MHVNLAYEGDNLDLQKKVQAFADQMAGNMGSKNDKKKKGGDKKVKAKSLVPTRESTLT